MPTEPASRASISFERRSNSQPQPGGRAVNSDRSSKAQSRFRKLTRNATTVDQNTEAIGE